MHFNLNVIFLISYFVLQTGLIIIKANPQLTISNKLQQLIYPIINKFMQIDNQTNHVISNKVVQLKKLKRSIDTKKKIKIDITKTEYPIIRMVTTKMLKWKLWSKEDKKQQSNIFWVDGYVSEDYVKKLKSYQRINHFPNSQQLGRKNNLAINLMKFKSTFPQYYNFFPQTWLIPLEIEQFKQSFKQNRYYIAKPESGSQGRGIYLFNKIQNIEHNYPTVVQEYIINPYLIDNLKFDFRIYVLLKSLSPLKIFIYNQGLARLATFEYQIPNTQNMNNLTMHLTNYAINKRNPLFIFNNSQKNDNVGHKRSYSSVLNILKQLGKDTTNLEKQIDGIIVKSIISSYDKLIDSYRKSRLGQQYKSICFEIFGFDIMINSDFKPILIQINHTPSFTTDTPLDKTIKKYLILDTLNLLNIDQKQKQSYIRGGKIDEKQLFNQKDFKKQAYEQNYYEQNHLGGYRKIYPTSNIQDMNLYDKFLNKLANPRKNGEFIRSQQKRNSIMTTKQQSIKKYKYKNKQQKEFNNNIDKEDVVQSFSKEETFQNFPIKIYQFRTVSPEKKKIHQPIENDSVVQKIKFKKNQVINKQFQLINDEIGLFPTENQTKNKKGIEGIISENYIFKKTQKPKLFDFDFQKKGLTNQQGLVQNNMKLKTSYIQNSKKFNASRNYKLIPRKNTSFQPQKKPFYYQQKLLTNAQDLKKIRFINL